MPMTPDNRNDGEEQEEDTDELPVINIDDDPENANWLRILAKRRQASPRRAGARTAAAAAETPAIIPPLL